jgi:hypothetical protein
MRNLAITALRLAGLTAAMRDHARNPNKPPPPAGL